MRTLIVALTAASVAISLLSLALSQTGESVSHGGYRSSVVDEAALRARAAASIARQSPGSVGGGAGATRAAGAAGSGPIAPAGGPGASAGAGSAGVGDVVSSARAAAAQSGIAADASPRECAAALDLAFLQTVWSDRQEVIVTFANGNGLDFAENLYWHATHVGGVRHMAVAGMDRAALEGLAKARIPCFPMRDAASSGGSAIGWGSAAFRNLGVRKISLLVDLLELGADTVLVDADTVLLKDPLPVVRRWPDAHVLASTDHLTNSTANHGLERLDVAHSHWNVGFFFLKASAIAFARAWRELLIKKPHWWDQHAFGWLLRQGVRGDGKGPGEGGPNAPGWWLRGPKDGLSDPFLFRCFTNHTLVCGTLPVALFANGHVGLVQRLHSKLRLPLHFVHATHQYSATAGKRHRLREAGLWRDPPSHYDPPGGLLHAPMQVPEHLLHPRDPATGAPYFQEQPAFLDKAFNHTASLALQAHFALANFQMRHVRDGIAAAWALGRKLVLPPLACGFDRGPFPHVGKSPGALEQVLPINPCPADYIFDLERKGSPGGAPMLLEVGREYSLLNNSRMPRAVLDGALRIDGVPPRVSAADLRKRWELASLVEVAALPPAFGEASLLTSEQQDQLKHALTLYTDVWCCINPPRWGLPGHVLYDPMFDVVPHVDRLRRRWTCPWHITIGGNTPRC